MLDKIVTLDNGKEYCIISETTYNNQRYCVAVEYFADKEDVGDKYFVFKENFENDRVILELVTDNDLEDYIILRVSVENDEKNNN